MLERLPRIPLSWLYEARERISPSIKRTPLTFDSDHNLFIKWENKQVTGSFKARGAINKILSLHAGERQKGIVAASAGNHGQGVALAGKLSAIPVVIFIPEQTPKVKVEAMKNLGADLRLIAGGYEAAEQQGIRYAADIGATWVSPYNDSQVISGQGTVALEILDELRLNDEASWIVPASGGGLLAGTAIAMVRASPKARLVAVQSTTSAFLHSIYYYGTQEGITELPTIAEGLAGPVEEGSITIPIIQDQVDEFLLVSEEDIEQAIAHCWYRYNERIEGAAAVAFAAVLSGQAQARPAVLIISGGNIQPELHNQIINKYKI